MKSKRNKTIILGKSDYDKFGDYFKLQEKPESIDLVKNKIINDDLLNVLDLLPSESIDLIFTDPPYLGHYNKFKHRLERINKDKFTLWCETWLKECSRLLKKTGSIYICSDWQSSGIFQDLLDRYFKIRNRITWKREKGRGAKSNWKNNMEDIWFASKSDDYIFNIDQVKIKKPVIAPYRDESGQAKDWLEENGERYRYTHPSNIWTDLIVPFWSMKENTFHPTQKPEKLAERVILASSNRDALVFDPFMGSGTTAVVARRLRRNFLGVEIDKDFYVLIKKRLEVSM